MTRQEAWVRFSYLGLSARRQRRLLERFGGPLEALTAPVARLQEAVGQEHGAAVRVVEALRRDVGGDLERMREMGIRLFGWGEEDYPAPLCDLPDPPCVLYARGDWQRHDERAVALVGTRNASAYGRLVAEELARELARRRVVVVSGLACGIDGTAHEGALQAGGRTLAVMGCGLDIDYPRGHAPLAERIARTGAVFSEYPLGTPPEGWRFPARNRIISGLARAVVVVEAGLRSGALITADLALEQGREVLAVPGAVAGRRHQGCHRLLKEGAGLVETVEDVLAALGWEGMPCADAPDRADPADLTPQQRAVWRVLSDEPQHIDVLGRQVNGSPAALNAALLVLELRGLARRLPGQYFQRGRAG